MPPLASLLDSLAEGRGAKALARARKIARRAGAWGRLGGRKALNCSLAWVVEPVWKWGAERCGRAAAALAFYAVFSLAPTLVVAIAAASFFFGAEAATGELASKIALIAGPTAAKLIEAALAAAWKSQLAKGASVWAVAAMLAGASAGFTALTAELNLIWGVRRRGVKAGMLGWARERMLSFLMALAMGGGICALIAIQATLAGARAVSPVALPSALAPLAQGAGIATAIAFACALLIKTLPAQSVRWIDAMVGGVVAAALVVVGKRAFGFYLMHVGAVSAFGAAGALAALLLWLWFGASALLFGAQVARCIELRRQGKPYRGSANDD
jgi:membrane protein